MPPKERYLKKYYCFGSISHPTKPNPENKIMELTNKLLDELDKQGYSISCEDVETNFGALHIWKYPSGKLTVETVGKFEISGRRSA